MHGDSLEPRRVAGLDGQDTGFPGPDALGLGHRRRLERKRCRVAAQILVLGPVDLVETRKQVVLQSHLSFSLHQDEKGEQRTRARVALVESRTRLRRLMYRRVVPWRRSERDDAAFSSSPASPSMSWLPVEARCALRAVVSSFYTQIMWLTLILLENLQKYVPFCRALAPTFWRTSRGRGGPLP